MTDRPVGTVTFLFTDVEGSTRLLQADEHVYPAILTAQRTILREAARRHAGYEVDARGEEAFVAFPRARDALAAAVAAQHALRAHPWPDGAVVRVRMGMHTGEPVVTDGGYVGMDVHRAARICASGYGGQILLSEATRSLLGDELPEGITLLDLGEHRLKDLIQPVHLFQVAAVDLPSAFPPLRTLATLPNNLPVELTSFIGRERELAGVKRRLAAARLLTLSGPGGCGKTRLAVHAAAEVLDDYPDGVWLVELSPLSDPQLIPQTIAAALGVREQSGRPLLVTVAEYLLPKTLLLVLDNCEHLLPGCAETIETLLRACPQLTVLATSREPTGVPGEAFWPVPPLAVPEPHGRINLDVLGGIESVRLFVERAQGVVRSFGLAPQNASAVAQICRQLDGIPLTIELAAARVKVLSVEEIAARLDDRFRLLTGGSRTALPRHQTLRATMDWSHDLLTPRERRLFRRLAVFAGGFTLPAAEAICAGDGVDPGAVLDVLTHLVDRSLVMVDLRGEVTRYRLLETVRQYGLERLLAEGEAPTIRARHRDWYLRRAEQAEGELHGPRERVWFDLLEAEHDNLRAAMDWSGTEPAGAERALRLAGALWWFWFIRGYLTEGRARLERALAADDVRSTVRAVALQGAGALAGLQGDFRQAVGLVGESVAILRELGDARRLPFALGTLGYNLRQQGRHEEAAVACSEGLAIARAGELTWETALNLWLLGEIRLFQGRHQEAGALLEESLGLFRVTGDAWGTAFAQISLGLVARHGGAFAEAEAMVREALDRMEQLNDKWGIAMAARTLGLIANAMGDEASAAQHHSRSLALFRELGTRWGIASSLRALAQLALRRGDLGEAAALSAESLSMFRELGDPRGTAGALQTAGLVARSRQDHAAAAELWRESLALFWRAGDRGGIVQSLRLLAEAAAERGRLSHAARLFGALEGLAEHLEVDPTQHGRADYERHVAGVRAQLPPEEYARAVREGGRMTDEEAVRFALASEGPAEAARLLDELAPGTSALDTV